MPRAISQKPGLAHEPAAANVRRTRSARDAAAPTMHNSATTTKNPIFNTDRFGQHILRNPLVAQGIVDKANLKNTDLVLEVGPGTGNLTVRILEKAKKVTVVEMDPRMAAELNKRVQGTPEKRKLEVIIGDFCKTDLPYFDVVISNTPYQISSPLVFKLLAHRPLFRVAILMFQREFALRLLARPGTEMWSRLSANVQLYAKVDHIMKVSRNSFRPPPNVESSVVRIVPINPPPPVRFEEFDGLARIIFTRRNKKVRSNFFDSRGVLDMLERNWRTWCAEKERPIEDGIKFSALVERVLAESGYADSRAAQMDVDDLLKLLAALHAEGIHLA